MPLRVLICESNKLSAILVSRLLALRGHQPTIVTPEEAATRIKARTYDCMLIDTHQLPALVPFADRASVIALTSLNSQETAAVCRAAGIERWLGKPVLAAELWAALDSVVIEQPNCVVAP